MKRPGVLEGYERAGRIERILSEHQIPIIPALESGGSGLHCLDYGNPFPEMLQLALSWAGGDVCRIDSRRLGGFSIITRSEKRCNSQRRDCQCSNTGKPVWCVSPRLYLPE